TKRGRTVHPPHDFVQRDIEPRLQVGWRLDEPRRRRRLETVGVAKAPDGKQAVTDVQQSEQWSGHHTRLLMRRSTASGPGPPKTRAARQARYRRRHSYPTGPK